MSRLRLDKRSKLVTIPNYIVNVVESYHSSQKDAVAWCYYIFEFFPEFTGFTKRVYGNIVMRKMLIGISWWARKVLQ